MMMMMMMMGNSSVSLWSLVLGFFLILLLGNPVTAILRMNDPLHSEHSERADVFFHHDAKDMHSRQRRDTRSDLPSTLHFSVRTADGAETHVQLEQHERTHDVIPAYLLQDGKVEKLYVDHDSNWALYTDEDTNAVFLVHRHNEEQPEDLTVNGVFNHQGQMMQMRPDYDSPAQSHSRVKREGARQHFEQGTCTTIPYLLARTEMKLFYGDDVKPMTQSPRYNFDASHFSLGDSTYINVISESRRRKREAAGRVNNIVEVCLSIDSLDYDKFLGFAGNDANQALSDVIQWYALMETIVNVMYDTYDAQSTSHCVNVRIVGIVISTTPAGTPWFSGNVLANGNIDGNQALDDWGKAGPMLFPVADNYIAMTGGDIEGISSTTIGIAFGGGMCEEETSAQVSENLFSTSTAAVIAHEMGHNFNALHDTQSGLGCSDSDQFIMSAILSIPTDPAQASNPWTFSSCSVQVFDAFLDTGTTNCLRTTSCPASILATDQLPGQAIDVDEQCRRFTGIPTSEFCRTIYFTNNLPIEDTMCYRFFCSTEGVSCSSTLPLDYTSCGNNKWCIKGVCTEDSAAPPRFEVCPAGDDPGRNCDPSSCSIDFFRTACCATCAMAAGTTLAPYVPPVTNPVTTAPPNSLCHVEVAAASMSSMTSVTSPTTPDTSPTTMSSTTSSTSPTTSSTSVTSPITTSSTSSTSPTTSSTSPTTTSTTTSTSPTTSSTSATSPTTTSSTSSTSPTTSPTAGMFPTTSSISIPFPTTSMTSVVTDDGTVQSANLLRTESFVILSGC